MLKEMLKRTSLLSLLLVAVIVPSVDAFSVEVSHVTLASIRLETSRSQATQLYMFGGLKDAFKNDDSLGARENAGLKNGPKYNDQVTVNGKAVPGAVVGQKLTVVASKVRIYFEMI
jgi:hypothetical protein